MTVIAKRSSTTARVSRNARSADGRCVPMTASTASAKAMSVAVGMRPAGRGRRGAHGDDRADVDERGHGHAARARRRRGAAAFGAVAQVAGDELALELDPRDEEEDREQAVGGPVPRERSRCSAAGPTTESREGVVAVAPGRVGPDQRRARRRRAAARRRRSRAAARRATRSARGATAVRTRRSAHRHPRQVPHRPHSRREPPHIRLTAPQCAQGAPLVPGPPPASRPQRRPPPTRRRSQCATSPECDHGCAPGA